MTELLRLHGLKKNIGNRVLFDIDNLVIDAAQAYMLSGPNGAGKSTLLRVICGLEPGEVKQAFFMGKETKLFPYPQVMRQAIGYVHQHPIMFSSTVAANIGYGLKAGGYAKHDIERKVDEALHWARLTALAHRRADSLSGGEKQRVALARAKVLNPKLFLLDEPTSSLDGQAREQVIELIPSLIAAGQSVIIATHDRELIVLSDTKRLDLRNGKLTEMATPPV